MWAHIEKAGYFSGHLHWVPPARSAWAGAVTKISLTCPKTHDLSSMPGLWETFPRYYAASTSKWACADLVPEVLLRKEGTSPMFLHSLHRLELIKKTAPMFVAPRIVGGAQIWIMTHVVELKDGLQTSWLTGIYEYLVSLLFNITKIALGPLNCCSHKLP